MSKSKTQINIKAKQPPLHDVILHKFMKTIIVLTIGNLVCIGGSKCLVMFQAQIKLHN